MSDTLEQVFQKQKTLAQLETELDAISNSIDPQFRIQFETYRFGVLGIISENVSVAQDERVQMALAEGHQRVASALSYDTGRLLDRRVRATIQKSASDGTHWEKVK